MKKKTGKKEARSEKTSKPNRQARQSGKAGPAGLSISPPKNDRFPIVGVGASAGGLEAFELLLAAMSPTTGMAFVLIPHLAPKHESILSQLLSKKTTLPVIQVQDGMTVRRNHVYVIPPDADMQIEGGILKLVPFENPHARRMPIDRFLRSLADDQQDCGIAVILSGTANDGTLGLQAIKAHGGITFAQDDKSAKYSGMPRSAVASGDVDYILPPDLIARELGRIAHHKHFFEVRDGSTGESPEPVKHDENTNRILALLKGVGQVDFSGYKRGTIQRRINRRMFLRKVDNPDAYLKLLRKDSEELQALFNDMLINVTGFFRDPEAFEALRKTAFPTIIKYKSPQAAIRAWVPGCSTGEEVYTLAISLLEYLGERSSNTPIQIFGTDVSEFIIQKARNGIYPESIAQDLSPERLRRFFQKSDGGYQINKNVRDLCLFARQDVSRDPPFSKLDLISCRNVMIYMGPILQKRIIPLFHYALNTNGVLFLGSSETIGSHTDLFATLDKKHKIYSKKGLTAPLNFEFVPRFNNDPADLAAEIQLPPVPYDLQRVVDQTLMNRYGPSCVMVNDTLDIVLFVGNTGSYLEPAPGNASLNLLRMVKPGLQTELRTAFQKTKQEGVVRVERVLVQNNGGFKTVDFEVIPIRNASLSQQHYLVVFEDTQPEKDNGRKDKSAGKVKVEKVKAEKVKAHTPGKNPDPEEETRTLRVELESTREYLQAIIEEQRTTNEELRSANEEIQSSNEELQSTNEELETAKEELQSANEELTTVNEELQNRNEELTQANNDLTNLLSSVSLPIVMLGSDMRIRRFTPPAEKLMNLLPGDVGRRITDIQPNIKTPDLRHLVAEVMDSLRVQDVRVEDNSGKWYSMRIRPYRTIDNKIDGVVMVLLDVPRPA